MPLFEVETEAHIIITWAESEAEAKTIAMEAYPGEDIRRLNECIFGEGDLYCSAWNLLALAGIGDEQWTPQYTYWKRPEQMEDGGENLPDA